MTKVQKNGETFTLTQWKQFANIGRSIVNRDGSLVEGLINDPSPLLNNKTIKMTLASDRATQKIQCPVS